MAPGTGAHRERGDTGNRGAPGTGGHRDGRVAPCRGSCVHPRYSRSPTGTEPRDRAAAPPGVRLPPCAAARPGRAGAGRSCPPGRPLAKGGAQPGRPPPAGTPGSARIHPRGRWGLGGGRKREGAPGTDGQEGAGGDPTITPLLPPPQPPRFSHFPRPWENPAGGRGCCQGLILSPQEARCSSTCSAGLLARLGGWGGHPKYIPARLRKGRRSAALPSAQVSRAL